MDIGGKHRVLKEYLAKVGQCHWSVLLVAYLGFLNSNEYSRR